MAYLLETLWNSTLVTVLGKDQCIGTEAGSGKKRGNEEGGRLPLLSSPVSRAGPTSGIKPRRLKVRYCNGASGLAAGQPRKPVAALIVDWFYALPPCERPPL